MGGYANKSSGAHRRSRRNRRLVWLVLVLGSWLAGPALADAPGASPGASQVNADRDRPVSTRPIRVDRSDGHGLDHSTVNSLAKLPLTRAAAQRRVEEMSPTAWLSRYGDVTIGALPH